MIREIDDEEMRNPWPRVPRVNQQDDDDEDYPRRRLDDLRVVLGIFIGSALTMAIAALVWILAR